MTLIAIILAIVLYQLKMYDLCFYLIVLALVNVFFLHGSGEEASEETCQWYETEVNGRKVVGKVNSNGKVVSLDIDPIDGGERVYAYVHGELDFNHAPAKVVNDALSALDKLDDFDNKVYLERN